MKQVLLLLSDSIFLRSFFVFVFLQGEPRTGAFEVVLKRGAAGQALKYTLLWSKLQVGEPSSDDPETLKAISEAIVMELKSELNKK